MTVSSALRRKERNAFQCILEKPVNAGTESGQIVLGVGWGLLPRIAACLADKTREAVPVQKSGRDALREGTNCTLFLTPPPIPPWRE